ncbi:MAG: M23 family metallopeptidase [Erysipelotrichaceae bacterium]
MNVKDIVKDKTLKTGEFIKDTAKLGGRIVGTTGKGLYHAGGSILRTSADVAVNYGSDPYEELEDVAVDGAKEITSNSVMLARMGVRTSRSLVNINRKRLVRKRWKDNVWKNTDKTKREKLYAQAKEKRNVNLEDDIAISKIEKKAEKEWKQKKWKDQTRKQIKNEYYQKANIKKGVNPIGSTNKMMKNQTRKLVNKTANSNDVATGIVGKTSKATFNTWRYRKQVAKTFRVVTMVVKSISNGIVAMVTSIPIMVATLTSSVTSLIIIFIVIIIASFFSDMEFSGRVSEFTKNEVYLEYRYKVNVTPDEVLAITSALGWTTQKIEDYERLFAFMLEGASKDGKISFNQMCDNVFRIYNPANYRFKEKTIEYQTKGSWLGEYKTSTISQSEWEKIWVNYYKGTQKEKQNYGNESHINALKLKAKNELDKNSKNYIGSYLIDGSYFKARPINLDDVAIGSATYKQGVRNLLSDTEFHAGTDIGVAEGTPLYAVFDADVVWAQKNIKKGGLDCSTSTNKICGQHLGGNQVVLKYATNDRDKGEPIYLYIAYYHMQKGSTTVKQGDKVKAGEHIGNAGSTGIADGSHLHFQAWLSKDNYKGKNYAIPYASEINKNNISLWQEYMDASMFTDLDFRNKIFGRMN